MLNGAVTGDVTKFRDRGGKLILFQGWADPIVPIGQTVNFYKISLAKFGGEEKTKGCARLFMVPGMGHCGFGTGPTGSNSSAFGGAQPPAFDPEHDMFTALSHWVEDGVAPAQVIATKFVGGDASKEIEMQRPLCPIRNAPGTRARETPTPPRISLAPSTRSEIRDENRSSILPIAIVPASAVTPRDEQTAQQGDL